MTSLHNSSQPMGTFNGTALLQLFNIVNEDHTGVIGINNDGTLPALVSPHFSTPPINSKSLLMKNVVAPNLGGSPSQCFSRLTQGVVFAFLRGEGKVEELPCLDSPDEKMSAVEKDDQEVTQVEDVVPSQKSIFKFLNGDVCQLLIFLVDFDLGSEKMDSSNLDAYENLSKHLLLLDLSCSSDGIDDMRHSNQKNGMYSTLPNNLQLTDRYAEVYDDVEWMITDGIVKVDGYSGKIDENILYSPFHHWHKMIKNDPLFDFMMENLTAEPHQCYGSENSENLIMPMFALKNSGFVIGNYHEETVARIQILFKLNDHHDLVELYGLNEKDVNDFDDNICESPTWPKKKHIQNTLENYVPTNENNYEGNISGISSSLAGSDCHINEKHCKKSISTSTHHHSFDIVSDPQNECTMKIHKETISHRGNTDSLNDCGTPGYKSNEVFGALEQHPDIGATKELKFSIPDPNELMKYLYGTVSSLKFLTSDPLNGEFDNFHFSSNFGNHDSNEDAKSEYLSDSITNGGGVGTRNDSEYGMFDIFGFATESEIGAMTGAFGEIETPDIPSLLHTSDIEKIRWNWCSRDVDSSLFNLSEHHDLLELYGLNEQVVIDFDDYFCESPTWPEKQHIQDSELCYIKSISTSTHHHSFDSMSGPQNKCTMEIHKGTISHCGNMDSLNDCGTPGYKSNEVFGTFEQHPVIGSTDQLKFCIPDPDELMKYLHDTISSPKFVTSDPPNGESDNFDFSSNYGIRYSDEVAKLDNLSDLIANSSRVSGENDNKYGLFDTFGSATESGIGAMTGAFGEIETSPIPRLPNISQIEEIRCNWSSREVDSSVFDFDNQQDLLELYGLSEQDVQANEDEFCDSPTWPGKR